MKAKKKAVRRQPVGLAKMAKEVAIIQADPEATPPTGVSAELHREIMRRINNRYYDNKDLCSMRRSGPGLAELAGVIPLTKGLGGEAIVAYAGYLEKVIATREHCVRCEAKVYAILSLVVKDTDPERASRYGRMVFRCKADLGVAGANRDFFEEVNDAAEQVAKRMEESHFRSR